ncbi:MAG: hypothetical protein ABJA86_03960 [Nocardioidaceae bacterium]
MQEPAAVPRPQPPSPEGGKALARLELFEDQRGASGIVNAARQGPDGSDTAAQAAVDPADIAFAAEYASTALALAEAPMAGAPTWRWLGPTYIPNGQTYGSARVDVSGRVAAIAVDPANSTHLLVGGAGGGVWQSFDSGASWSPRTDNAPSLTTGAIAFDPSQPDIVYVGTGEGNWYARWGAGVLRSTDGGSTFALLAGAPFVGRGFFDLVVDPTDSGRLLAATTGGVYLSTDAGASWTNVVSTRCWDLSALKRGNHVEVLAACSDGVHRSVNGGASFTPVTMAGAPAGWDRLAVSHAPSQPAIAHAWGASGGTAYLYRRSGRGGGWTAQSVPANDTGQAWYDWFCATAPDTPDRVYLGAIHVYRGERSGTTWTWENISSRPTGDSIHPDQHAIAFDPSDPGTVYVGCDGGLFRTPDRGTTWTALNRGLGITEVEYIAQRYGTKRWLIAGTQDNGSMRYTGSAVWDHVADGDGGDCGVNRADPTRVYHSYYRMGMERSTSNGDWGSFSWIGPNVPNTYSALFYPPLEVNGSTVAQAGQSAYVSRDQGGTFTNVALPGGVVTAMCASTGDRIYVGTNGGAVYRLDWGTSSWSVTTLTSPRQAWISDIAVDPSNPSRVWATSTMVGGGRVFRSDNGGSSWTDVSAGLPSLPVNAVEIDIANGNRAWVAADLGVYETRDAGATWTSFSAGLPNSLIADLVFHPHARVLRAGTRNRGVWELEVDGPSAPWCGAQWHGQLGPNQTVTWFTFNWPASWHVIWTIIPTTVSGGAGRQVTWSTSVQRASDEFATYWITVSNLTGSTVEFDGRFCVLSLS